MSRLTKDNNSEIEALRRDNERLRAQLEEFRESHETMRAIHEGQVEALVVSGPEGDRIFTLESAEEPYRLMVEQMQEAAVTLGHAGTIDYANRAFSEMLQRPLEHVIGSGVEDHVVATDQPALAALLAQRRGRIEVAIQAADGTRIPVQVSASVVGPHRTARLCLVLTDLTERKRAERRLRATFDNAAAGIVETDDQDRYVAVNDRLCQMLGYQREELLGMSMQELTHPEDRLRSEELRTQLRDGRIPMFRHEQRYLKRDGMPLWVDVAISAVRDEAGRYLYSVGTIVDISARKAAEAQVHLLAAALEAAPNAISVSMTDAQGTIVWVNPAFMTLTGYSAEEVIGHSHHILSSGRQDEPFYRNLWQTIERGEVWRGELVNRRKDGTLYQEEMGITPLRDEEGKITHFVAIKQDITARKQAEEALRKSEQQLRFVCESIPHLVWAARPDGYIDYLNQRVLDYTGAKHEEMTGWGWLPFIHPEDRQQTTEHWQSALRDGSEVRLSYRLRHGQSGEYRWHAVHALPLRDAGGRIIRWYGTCTDIDEQKRAEELLRRAAAFDEAALKSLGEGLYTIDEKGLVTSMNPAAEELFGWTLAEVRGKKMHEITHHHYRDGRPFPSSECAGFQVLTTGVPLKNYEDAFIRKDGTFFDVTYSITPMRDAAGKINGLVVVFSDITERKRAEAALRESEERFRVAQELSPDGFTILRPLRDAQGHVVDFTWVYENEAVARMAGTDPKTVVGRRLLDVMPGHVGSPFLQAYQEVAETGKSRVLEASYQGDTIPNETWFRVAVVPLGEDIAILAQDTTQRRRAEEALRRSEAQFHDLAEAMPQLVWIARPDGYHEYFNAGCHDYLGMSFDQLAGTGWSSCLHPDDRQRALDRWGHSLRTGESYEIEYRLRRARDGAYRWFLARAVPVRDERSAIVRWFGTCTDIDDQKRAEERLEQRVRERTADLAKALAEVRESEQRFRTMADAITQLAWTAHADGYIYWYNRRWYEYTGTTPKDMEGWGWQSVHDPKTLPAVLERWKASIATGEPFEMTFPLRGADGVFRPFLTRIQPLKNADGRVVQWFGTNTDVDELTRAEAALRESEGNLHNFLNTAATGLVRNSRDLRYLSVNTAYADIAGRPVEQIIGHSLAEVLGEPALEKVRPYIERVLKGERVEYETELPFAGSGPRWIHAIYTPDRDATGAVIGWVGSITDITTRKRAEEALRESDSRLKMAHQAAKIGAFEWNMQTDVNTWTPELEAMYGLAPGEFGKTEAAWEQLVHPEDRAAVLKRVQQAFETGEPGEQEWRAIWPDGSVHWILGRFQVFKDAANKPLRLSGVNIDITPRKQAEAALRELNETLEHRVVERTEALHAARAAAEQANAAKDQFLAVLSHELRTPLTPVLPVLEELGRQVPDGSREDVEMALRNVELEARLIDDLLDVTRISQGKIELHRQKVQLCTILRRAAEVCAPDIEARRLHFGIKVEDGPYWVDADPARLQQVFWNLIKNAIKFTPHGGCVGIHCQSDGNGHVLAQVKDSGRGIEPEALARIFNAFEQVDRSVTRQFGGLGLGLAISRTLVELHDGTIQAYSEGEGKGATFTVKLPTHKVAEGEIPSPAPGRPVITAQAPTPARTLHILLVEDHGDTARIMRRLLKGQGHEVETAGDVATALELAEQKSFDLLLSDLGLPDGSGLDLMRQLVAQGRSIPAIAFSGYGQDEDIAQSRQAGFVAHLTKPVNMDQLASTIATVTGQNAAPPRLAQERAT